MMPVTPDQLLLSPLILLILVRRSAGPCDIEEKCTANGTCPEDTYVGGGTLCRSVIALGATQCDAAPDI
jgi:hypothetical protein